MKLVVLKEGRLKLMSEGTVLADGTVRIRGQAVVLKKACQKAGLDPKIVQQQCRPAHCLARMGMNEDNIEILSQEQYDERQKAFRQKEKETLERQIPGITRMRELEERVLNNRERYEIQFKRMLQDGDNDGAQPPAPVDEHLEQELAQMKANNPRAALYLLAEKQAQGTSSYSATSGQMEGARRAMTILRNNGSIQEAKQALAFRYESSWD